MNHSRHHQALSLQQAVQSAPTLARLSQIAEQSGACLAVIQPLLPPALRGVVRAGALEQLSGNWCLLVPHAAAAAKLRQLTPALLQVLARHESGVQSIRIKIVQPG
ncbi:MAG: DciA family protein [Pseudomonadota bacterium]|nr:DciA family protein [Pseudomonadota bacterium]